MVHKEKQRTLFQINGDRVALTTPHPLPVGDYKEIKPTFKCTRQQIITDNMGHRDDEVKLQHRAEREKQPEPHHNRFITFMIENPPDDMERVMKKAGCTDYEIRDAYNHNHRKRAAAQRLHRQQDQQERQDRPEVRPDDTRSQHADNESQSVVEGNDTNS
eukprot:1108518-Amphidinium_carterae.1